MSAKIVSVDAGLQQTELLEAIRDAVCCIVSQENDYPSEPTWFCEDGVVTGGVIYVLDENLNLTPVFIDQSGIPTPGYPAGNPCISQDWEHKNVLICFTDGVNYYQKEICRVYNSDELVAQTVLWHLPNGTQSTTPPPGNLIPCEAVQSPIDVPLCSNI